MQQYGMCYREQMADIRETHINYRIFIMCFYFGKRFGEFANKKATIHQNRGSRKSQLFYAFAISGIASTL
jgi:hypothetical protein